MDDDSIAVRPARPDDALAVRRLLDAALLAVDGIDERVEAGDALVATVDGRIAGAVVLAPRDRGAHVAGIAVRRRRRGRGIGSALIEAAVERRGRLAATFDERVRPFYESLGFEIDSAEEPGRLRGVVER